MIAREARVSWVRGGAATALLIPLLLWLGGCWLFNVPPVAAFTLSPLTGQAPLTVSFSAMLSEDEDGDIVDWEWDFGDGKSGVGETIAHTYDEPGPFVVVLRVTDDRGDSATTRKTLYVTPADPLGPTASFTASPSSGTSPLSVSLNASASTYALGTIEAYEWDFGDGRTGFGVITSHTYVSSGSTTYTVTLTVRATDGKEATATKTINVTTSGGGGTPVAGAPSARFSILFDDPAVAGDEYTNRTVSPVRVWLDPSDSKAATGRTIAHYSWSFGDGTATTSISPIVQEKTYFTNQTSKTFSLTLVVIDDVGAINTLTKTVKVSNHQPVAGFEVSSEADVRAGTMPTADDDWWRNEEDGLDDDRVTYTDVPVGNRTVWIRSRQIEDARWLGMDRDDPVPNASTAKPAEFDSKDGSNMCYDPEGQTWEPGGEPTWFPNRAWGIQTLKVNWGDASIDYIPFQDNGDTVASHLYDFTAGGVQSWTITVTAIDYLGNEKSLSRTITMNAGG